MKWEIVDINKLRPLELVFPTHLKNLTRMILSINLIKSPILADKNTGIVLDGSHRYVFFLGNGYKEIPVQFVNYDDENIRVGGHLIERFTIKDKVSLTKEEVKKRGLSGNLFQPRTTRHFFPFRKIDDMDLPLDKLKRGNKIDISKFIAKVNKVDEINHNKCYIEEIEQEIDEIIIYLEEQRRTKKYLLEQINQMEHGGKRL